MLKISAKLNDLYSLQLPIATAGNVSIDELKKYIEDQREEA